eukprot:1292695-Rhodomonas_salina.2
MTAWVDASRTCAWQLCEGGLKQHCGKNEEQNGSQTKRCDHKWEQNNRKRKQYCSKRKQDNQKGNEKLTSTLHSLSHPRPCSNYPQSSRVW